MRHTAPFDALKNSFRETVVKAVQKAGVKVPADKPVGMHSFRHSIATAMLSNGVKLTEIAQTLGHTTPESTQTYISTDTELLRQCALDVGRILRTFKIKKNVEVTDNGKIII